MSNQSQALITKYINRNSMNLQEAYQFYGGIKLTEIANKCDVSESFVSQVMSGKRSSAFVTTEIRKRIEMRIKILKENLCGTKI